MSKNAVRLGMATRLAFLILVGLVALGEPVLAIVFFIPIAGWFLWRDQDRIAELEKKVAALAPPLPKVEDSQLGTGGSAE